MSHVTPFAVPPRVPPVEPELLASAMFIFSEYLARLEAEALPPDEDDGDGGDGDVPIDTRLVLDLLADDLGTNVQNTLALYMRVTALYRLLAASPSLAQLAMEDPERGGALTEDALLAAARLDLHVVREGEDGSADYDAREFRDALRDT
ncbi:MAG TPA: hypothetical protein VMU87_17000 [Stellaceae bacterium]|nr:hypothetical protein [Stellaceae bacterium]